MVRLRPLDRKLLRDLLRIRGQVLAIALVMASGVALLVMSLTAIEALENTAVAYYERYRFAHVFARVKRAPEHLTERMRRIAGVHVVETRVVHPAVLDIAGFEEPVVGQLVSVPEHGEPALNRLALRQGRYPNPAAADETILSEPFADAHGLQIGGSLRAVINGHWRHLRVVGIALSPEYVYTIGPGALMPDDRRFGVLWLGRRSLQAAYDLDGAFNDVSLELVRGTDTDLVIERLDRLLAPYGGVGAYARADQLSNWFLSNEIVQLRTLAGILPVIFLAVSAFLTNMVLARLIAVERSEIGLLKAFGYDDRAIATHYVKLVLVIGVLGVAIGWFIGFWLGRHNTQTYAEFYRFPFLLFHPGPRPFLIAAAASIAAALLGALFAVRRVLLLSPAESMRPPMPPLFRRAHLGGRVQRWLEQPTRIILRQIGRWPLRSLLTSAGIGMAVAVLIISLQWLDAINHIVDVYFLQAQGQDVTVGFAEVRGREAERNLARLPGVLASEPMRVVAAKLRAGSREQREGIQGVPAHQQLYRVYDAAGHALELPPEGLVISSMLAKLLDVGRGDRISVEVLEGRRPRFEVPVVDVFETYIGSPAYMDIRALNRLMREGASISAAHVRVDELQRARFLSELKHIPQVSSIMLRQAAVATFHDTMARTLLIFVSFFVVFSCTLAFGVTYNGARIALSERGRELATLRVIGFTRAEISYILLGETGVLTLAAIPLGCAFGYGLARLVAGAFETELYRVPFVIASSTYGWAIVVGLIATAASALMVRRRLDHLDLIAVLKTRE
ncbi:MAG TPA: FtsX-like permease family protein [Steroidobacteraceae bacterium]|nr:FtsX-like permease family protein [Steroidobacteraceae bacterium]